MTLSVLYLIIIATVLVSLNGFNKPEVVDKLIFSPYKVEHYKEYYRVISHVLVHADTTHLIFNMFSLYFLGKFMENQLIMKFGFIAGEFHFVALYVLGALFSTIIPFARNKNNPNYQALGASGAVSAVIFASIIWDPKMELFIMFIPIAIPAYIFGPVYLLFEFIAYKRGNTGIAHDAHIGGAVFGIIYILIINIDKGKDILNVIFG